MGVPTAGIAGCCCNAPAQNSLRLLNNGGTVLWRRHQYQGISDGPTAASTDALAVSGDVIASGFQDTGSFHENAVVGWSAAATQLWRYNADLSGVVEQIVTLANGNFVCSDFGDDSVFALRASDGVLLWTNTDPAGVTADQRMAVNGNDVAVLGDSGGGDYTFYIIDGTDGSTDASTDYDPTGTFNPIGICAGGFGTYTIYANLGGSSYRFEGLDAAGALNGTGFTVSLGSPPHYILPSPAGNLLILLFNGDIQERNSSGTLLQSDTSTFGTLISRPVLATDDAGNIYAFSVQTGQVNALLVKYDGDDLTTVDWSHTIPDPPGDLVSARALALHSPSSNASPVIGYTNVPF